MKTTRCTDCAAEFTNAEIEGAKACPTCGSPSLPSALADDVTIQINWHELRILGIWASNYADAKLRGGPGERTLRSILKRIHAQHPERSPLTLGEDIQALANVAGDVEVVGSDGRKVVKQNKPS